MKTLFFYTLLLFSFVYSNTLYAQTNDSIKMQNLSEVEVSAHTIPSTSRSTSPLQVITSDAIILRGIQSVSDAVRRFNGVVLKDYGGIGGLKTVSIRGMGAEHTAISYDGIVVNNMQSGQVDLGRFVLDNISVISLSIGQSDNIFQTAKAFASTGVLNLQTVTPQFTYRNYEGKVKATTGSFGLFNPIADYSHKLNNTFAISANASWQRADGSYPFRQEDDKLIPNRKRKNSDVDILRSEINIYSNFGKTGNLNTKVYYFDSERGLPSSIILGNDYTTERLWNRNLFAQTSYNKIFGSKFKFKSQAKYDNSYTRYMDVHSKYENQYGTNKLINKYNEQEAYLSNTLLYIINEKIDISLSEDLSFNKMTDKMATPINSDGYAKRPHPKRYNSLTAAAIQYKTTRFTLTSNLLMTYTSEKNKNDISDRTYKKLSPSIGASYEPFNFMALRIRTSYKHSFRIPTFTELYYASVEKALKPESAKQFNLGLTWVGSISDSPINFINISADGYYNKVNDKIVIMPTMFIPKTLNFGEVEMKGLDVKLATEIAVSKKVNINIDGVYSFMNAIDVTSNTQKNYKEQIPYTPKHSGSISLSIINPLINFSYSMVASGERYANLQNIKENRVNGYTDHSISLHKQLKIKDKTLYLQGNILNIWNTRYDVIKYYPMPGRSFYISAGYKY